MDAISYSLAAKGIKRLNGLYYNQEVEPSSALLGTEWHVPSTSKIYKRVNDGVTDIWIDINTSTYITPETFLDASQLDFGSIPVTDPLIAGRMWSDSGVLKISAGS